TSGGRSRAWRTSAAGKRLGTQEVTTAATVESEGRNSSHSSRHAPRCCANSGLDRHRSTASLLSQLPNETKCLGSSTCRISTKPCAPEASRCAHVVKEVHLRTNSSSFPGFTIQLPDVNGWPSAVTLSDPSIVFPPLPRLAPQRAGLDRRAVVAPLECRP